MPAPVLSRAFAATPGVSVCSRFSPAQVLLPRRCGERILASVLRAVRDRLPRILTAANGRGCLALAVLSRGTHSVRTGAPQRFFPYGRAGAKTGPLLQ